MSSQDAPINIEHLLADLVMKCPELTELEARLSQFNIFRVLRADRHEIRHSNMLSWLLTPDEAHGMGDLFLRRWLMRIVHDATMDRAESNLPSPIEIDALDIEYVARERENIDLLIELHPSNGPPWVACIENKVESNQHSGQLRRYRSYVEHRYSDAAHRLYIFLTKYEELPEDSGFVTSSYSVLADVLGTCLSERASSVGSEPKLLLEHYLALLAEDFVEDNRSVQLARQIYLRHRQAIDFILENKSDPISEASISLEEALRAQSAELGIVLAPCGKGRVRFLPHAWDVLENSGGTAWGPNSRIVLYQVSFWSREIELQIVIGRAPDNWADRIWSRAATPPFKQEWKQRPKLWITPYRAKSGIAIEKLIEDDREESAKRILDWLHEELRKPKHLEAVKAIRELLEELKAP